VTVSDVRVASIDRTAYPRFARDVSERSEVFTPATERAFAEHRSLLHAVAYRVLGSVAEAQDVVQDAWLRWSRVDVATVANAEGYLVRVATRLAIDRLRSARGRRESYVGSWLPEPLLTDPDAAQHVLLKGSVSTAMLLVLQTLSPVERAVFVLSETFGYGHHEIAHLVGRKHATVRQIALRARKAVETRHRRYDTDQATRRQATERFMAACTGGDLNVLMGVLAPDVTMVSDGGGFAGAPRTAIHGRERAARAAVILSAHRAYGSLAQVFQVNDGPGIIIRSGRTPVLAATFHLAKGKIELIHVVGNPEKLTGVAL
jgi:RNA polymerase sigma-70 factor (ECF subfamily)